MASETQKKLPFIDLSKGNLNPNTTYWELTRGKVRKALEDYGCFVVRYDEITPQLHQEMLEAIKDTFDVLATKECLNDNNEISNWMRISDPTRHFEGFNFKNITSIESLNGFVNTLWPLGNDTYCQTMLKYAKLLTSLEETVLKLVYESYGVMKYFDSQFESMTHQIGTIKYGATDNRTIGFGAHTDKCLIVILDSNFVNGLEIQNKDGEWIAYDKVHSHYVIMAGDAFLAWSNGRIHSPFHRVIYGGDEDRYTIKLDAYARDLVEVPTELVDDEHPLLFKPFSNFGYVEYCKTTIRHNLLKSYCGI